MIVCMCNLTEYVHCACPVRTYLRMCVSNRTSMHTYIHTYAYACMSLYKVLQF